MDESDLPLDAAHAEALLRVAPWAKARPRPLVAALAALLEAEQGRQGRPDATGALHPFALTQGTLLAGEFDLSVHGHRGWEVGAVIADVRELIRVNQEHGFAAGDSVLRATVQSLQASLPRARVVRIHSDAFAALLLPSADTVLAPTLQEEVRRRLAGEVPRVFGGEGSVVEHTVSLLSLTIERPSHWQVLGPLLWAELERAHAAQRRGLADGLQLRRLSLEGFLPQAAPSGGES